MGKLTMKEVSAISEPGRYADGNGLYLVIAPGGSKNWIQRIRLDGKRTDKGLGGVGKVTLATARKVATANLAAIQQGVNPFAADYTPPAPAVPAPLSIPTFSEAVQAVYDLNRAEWGEATAKRWIARMQQHACPALGDMAVDAITRRDLAALLTPLRREHHETARKVRQGLAKVFRWARANDYRVDDPADDALGELVEKVKHQPEHRESLPYCEVATAIHKLRFGYSLRVTRLAFEFLILTAARTGEVRFMTWEEVDLDAAVWEIPAERMKAGRSHRIPLSDQAVAILRQLRFVPRPDAADDDLDTLEEVTSGYVFTMPNGKTLSENALLNRARKDKLGCVPHGMCSSFRDWAKAEYRGRWESIELALAHTVGTSVTQAYDRDDLLEERAAMMQAWGDFLDPAPF